MAEAPAGAARPPGVARLISAQVGYQLRLLSRTPRAIFASLLLPGLLLVLRLRGDSHPGGAQAATLVAGLAVFGVLSTAYVTMRPAWSRPGKTGRSGGGGPPRRRPGADFAGRIAATVLFADASGAVIMGAGAQLAHIHLDAGIALSLLAVVGLGALAWAACGTAVTAVIGTAESAWPLLAASYLPVVLLSGVFGAASEPGWLAGLLRWLACCPLAARPAPGRRLDPGAAAHRRRRAADPGA